MKCGSARLTIGDVVKERVERCKDPQESGFERFVGLEHLDTGRLEVIRFGSTNDVTTGCKICRKGDILFGRRNPYLRRASIVNFDATCSGDIIVLIPDESKILQDYLPILLTSKIFWKKAMSSQGGTMSKRIQMEDLASYEFTLPECKIQRKIVDLIWSIEKQINLMNKQICDLNLLIKSRFIEMFSDYDKASLTELADITMGQSPDSSTYNDQGIGVPFYQGKTEFTDTFVTVNKYCSEPKKMAKEMDILMSVRAPVGAVNLTSQKCCIGRGLAAITPKEGRTDVLFLFNALKTMEQQISDMGVGSTFTAISKDDMKKIRIPVAPINLQNQFSDFVKQVDKSKYNLQSYIEELTSMQISLINNPGVSGNEAE